MSKATPAPRNRTIKISNKEINKFNKRLVSLDKKASIKEFSQLIRKPKIREMFGNEVIKMWIEEVMAAEKNEQFFKLMRERGYVL